MLSYFASFIAQGGYKGSVREIYVLIAGDFQERSSRMALTCSKNPHLIPEIKMKSRLERLNPWCFSNLIWNALFSLSFCLWVYLIEDKEGVSNKMPICIIWKKHPQKMHKHLNHHREDSTELRIDHHGHIYKPTSGSLLTSVAFLVHFI